MDTVKYMAVQRMSLSDCAASLGNLILISRIHKRKALFHTSYLNSFAMIFTHHKTINTFIKEHLLGRFDISVDCVAICNEK